MNIIDSASVDVQSYRFQSLALVVHAEMFSV